MKTPARLFVSVPDDTHLDERRKRLKKALARELARQGFVLAGFESDQFGTRQAGHPEAWSVERTLQMLRGCDGAVVLGLARRQARLLPSGLGPKAAAKLPWVPLATPYNHLEGALALTLGLPVLLCHEEGMAPDGVFNCGLKSLPVPAEADEAWAASPAWRRHVQAFRTREIAVRRDLFLGYCSRSVKVANALRDHLEGSGVTVMDWRRDFAKAGSTIMEEVARAGRLCRCAVFLFTKDDELAASRRAAAGADAVPRDNVLLEAGWFLRSHGAARVAIVREAGAKMPADLGGLIYLGFDKPTQLAPLKRDLQHFVDSVLGTAMPPPGAG